MFFAKRIALLIMLSVPCITASQVHNLSAAMGTIIPFYIYPTQQALQPLISAKKRYPKVPMIVVLNPNSGPGTIQDPSYVSAVNTLRQHNIQTAGYVHTSYGTRPASDVQAEIGQWKTWFNPDGIFLDEMASDMAYQGYYGDLTAFIKATPQNMKFTIGNPGTAVDPSYVQYVDTVIIYENGQLPTSASYGAWNSAKLSPKSAGLLMYGIEQLPSNQFIGSLKNFVGWIYLTSGTLPNPWGTLPAYFQTLLQKLAAIAAVQSTGAASVKQ